VTGQARSALRGQLMPPWLWVWLIGDLAVLIPGQISDERYQFAEYTGHGDISGRLTAGIPYKLLLLFSVVAALTYAVLAAGTVAALLPHLRGRWVQKRFRLMDDHRTVIAEMQRFVSQYDPAIQLRVAMNGQQLARIYPTGWRTARIAVFLPLVVLWSRDRPAAQAVLLHEVAHRRHGDQFVIGLGSPFTRLIRIWVPAFILLVLTPVLVYAALGGGLLAQAVSGQGALELLRPAELLILPVAALWLASHSCSCKRRSTRDPLSAPIRASCVKRAWVIGLAA
jgi:Zn-dependent protease with chaperone function